MLRRCLLDIVLSLNVGILQIRFFIIFLNKIDIKLSFFLALKCYTVRILSFFKAKLVNFYAGECILSPDSIVSLKFTFCPSLIWRS